MKQATIESARTTIGLSFLHPRTSMWDKTKMETTQESGNLDLDNLLHTHINYAPLSITANTIPWHDDMRCSWTCFVNMS